MESRMLRVMALAAALGGVPFLAAAAEPSSNAAVIALAVTATAVMLAGIVLLVARRPDSSSDATGQERTTDATDQIVSAALARRTLRRGRLRLDDEVLAGSRTDATDAPTRRSD